MDADDVTLREFLEQRIDALEKLNDAQFAASKDAIAIALKGNNEAVGLALKALDDRLKVMNEFRATISDNAAHFLTKSENDTLTNSLQGRLDRQDTAIKELQLANAEVKGKASVNLVIIGFIVSVLVGVVGQIVQYFIRKP